MVSSEYCNTLKLSRTSGKRSWDGRKTKYHVGWVNHKAKPKRKSDQREDYYIVDQARPLPLNQTKIYKVVSLQLHEYHFHTNLMHLFLYLFLYYWMEVVARKKKRNHCVVTRLTILYVLHGPNAIYIPLYTT